MSILKLDSKDDIKLFLKLLAEESVSDARESILKDPLQTKTIKGIRHGKEIFSSKNIREQDEDEEVSVDVEEESEEPSEEHEPEASLSSITDAVKDLRSGRGVGDTTMQKELRTYFDRLSEPERSALLTFMQAFAGILTGEMTGTEAPDPSDAPTSIGMTRGDKEIEAETEIETEEEPEEEEETEEEEVEDTTPPIKAGEGPPDLSEIRKRVRALMRS